MNLPLAFVVLALSIVTATLGLVYLYYWFSFHYWKKQGIPQIDPSFPFGSSRITNTGITFGAITADFYEKLKQKNYKYGGVFAGPSPKLLLTDLELIKQILTKDFQYFTGRGIYYNEEDEPLGAHIFNVEGKRWRNLRRKLTPTFTSGKMKMMFNALVDCSEDMEASLQETGVFDLKDLCARFTTDAVASCAFGIQCNSFKHPDAEFRAIGSKIFGRTAYTDAKNFLVLAAPELAKFFGVTVFAEEVVKFFNRVVLEVISARETNNIRRNDFMQLLMDMKGSMEDKDETVSRKEQYTLSVEEIVAQCFFFFVAGFDTSSSTMQFCLYELARNEELQQKVRREVDELYEKNGGTITYQGVMELKFLGQVVDETLRIYPSVPTITRRCEKNYPLPGSTLTLERGTLVLIPVYGIHHDEDFYPDPEQFDPERFSEENKMKIPRYAYMPFGEGPKTCLGLRFGLMQVKVGLCALLRNFQFRVSPKTEAVEVDKASFLIATKSPIYLEYSRIK